MDRLVDHLFVFEGEGVVTDYPGNYSQYREWLKDREEPQVSTTKKSAEKSVENLAGSTDTGLAKRKPSFKEKREFEQIEKEIVALTSEKEMITGKLNDGHTPFEELQNLSMRIGVITQLLDEKEIRWLELSEIV